MVNTIKRGVLVTLILAALISILVFPSSAADNMKLRSIIIPSEPWLDLDIEVDKGEGAVYYEGEGIYFNVKSNRNCYIYIIEISTSGEVRLLYPNIRDRSNYLRGGENHRLPKGYTLSVAPPEGIESIIAIATERPLRDELPWLRRSIGGTDFLPVINLNPERFLDDLKKGELSDRHDRRWAADVTWFEIRRHQLPEYGQVYITTNPSASRIFIDGREIGRSPLSAVRLSYGVHEVTAINEGYYTETRRVEIKGRGTEYVDINMRRLESGYRLPAFNRREILKDRVIVKRSIDVLARSFRYRGYSGKVDIVPSDKGLWDNRVTAVTGYFTLDGESSSIFTLNADDYKWDQGRVFAIISYPFEVTITAADSVLRSMIFGDKYFDEISFDIIVSYIGE